MSGWSGRRVNSKLRTTITTRQRLAKRRLTRDWVTVSILVFGIGLGAIVGWGWFFFGALLGFIPKLWSDVDAFLDFSLAVDRVDNRDRIGKHRRNPPPPIPAMTIPPAGAHPHGYDARETGQDL